MTLILALVNGILFGVAVYLMLKRDLIRVLIGILLISNGIILFILGAGLTRGVAPIYPVRSVESISDPLVQALALTAIVIGLGISVLLFSLVYRVYGAYASFDQEILLQAEKEEANRLEAEEEEYSL